MVIDPGMFTAQFEDAIESVGEFIDLVKFGWGACLGYQRHQTEN
jgi:phosphosulfolactate synthase (CoM biosynthesis protein A)